MDAQLPRGFTLVELIAVIVLASIIAVIAIPRTATTSDASAAAQTLVASLRFTQALAMTHGMRYRLNITPPNTYTITTASGTNATNLVTNSTSVTLPAGVTFGTITNLPSNLVGFNGLGQPYTNTAVSTSLATTAVINILSGGVTRTVNINSNGMVSAG